MVVGEAVKVATEMGVCLRIGVPSVFTLDDYSSSSPQSPQVPSSISGANFDIGDFKGGRLSSTAAADGRF